MTHKTDILKHLKSGKEITPIDALNLYGCFRLAARIQELRETYNIEKRMVSMNDSSFASYRLVA